MGKFRDRLRKIAEESRTNVHAITSWMEARSQQGYTNGVWEGRLPEGVKAWLKSEDIHYENVSFSSETYCSGPRYMIRW